MSYEFNRIERSLNLQNPLETIAREYPASKIVHGYMKHYWNHFRDIRLSVRTVLEIGIQNGFSIKMWERFFPNATIYGVDIDPKCRELEGERIKVFIGDQSDPNFLDSIVKDANNQFDIIIDDGSHVPEHQCFSFKHLMPFVSPCGYYVIEDINVACSAIGITLQMLREIMTNINYCPESFRGNYAELTEFPESTDWFTKNITGISFYRYIAFINRGSNPQSNKYLGMTSDLCQNCSSNVFFPVKERAIIEKKLRYPFSDS